MKLLVLTLEFSCATFSGNGIYCRSQVRALSALGHELLVIAGRPDNAPDAEQAPTEGARQLLQIPLPVWNRLDALSGWREFAKGCEDPAVVDAVLAFGPSHVLGIDWSSLPAYQALQHALEIRSAPYPPFVYMNYRVYERSPSCEADALFYSRMEGAATQCSILTTALSTSDADHLRGHVDEPKRTQGIKVLLPALRSDMETLPLPIDMQPTQSTQALTNGVSHALTNVNDNNDNDNNDVVSGVQEHHDGQQQQQQQHRQHVRRYVTCCVRLSDEKQPDRFVRLVEAMEKMNTFEETDTIPLMCGSATTPYAEDLKKRLRKCRGADGVVIEERFLGPEELAQLYSHSVLNVHPPVYDAYGMTIVEAASQGVPSVVQQGGFVGATELLCGDHDQVVLMDMNEDVDTLARAIDGLLRDRETLHTIGRNACCKARSWTESANAQALIDALLSTLTSTHRCTSEYTDKHS